MHSVRGLAVISAWLGCALLAAAHAQSQPKLAGSPPVPMSIWPMDVVTTPEAKACVQALLEEEANEDAVSAPVGESFIGCMQPAHAENFYEFDRYKANGTILLKKPDPCLKKAAVGGAICVVLPTASADPLKGKIVITSLKGAQVLSLTIDSPGQSSPPRQPLDECKNAYGDACGTKYGRPTSNHGNTD